MSNNQSQEATSRGTPRTPARPALSGIFQRAPLSTPRRPPVGNPQLPFRGTPQRTSARPSASVPRTPVTHTPADQRTRAARLAQATGVPVRTRPKDDDDDWYTDDELKEPQTKDEEEEQEEIMKRIQIEERKKPTSIIEALSKPLPWLRNHGNPVVTVGPSGESTRLATPPRVILHQEAKDLFLYYQRMYPLLRRDPKLRRSMPQTELSHIMNSEASMSDAVRLYLIHPVTVAMQAMLKEGRLIVQPQAIDEPRSRTDFMFIWLDKNEKRHIIGILELKKRKALLTKDFEAAWVSGLTTRDEQLQVQEMIIASKDTVHKTNLKENAIWIGKQASKYSTMTPCIAAFDWETLMMFEFPQRLKLDKPGPDRKYHWENLTKGIWFREKDDPAKGMNFRSMLLGFLVYSVINHPPLVNNQKVNIFKDPSLISQAQPKRIVTQQAKLHLLQPFKSLRS